MTNPLKGNVDTRFLNSGKIRQRYKFNAYGIRTINKAKALTGFNHDHTAMEAICLDFLSRHLTAAHGLNRAVQGNKRFLIAYYPDEYGIVREALNAAREFVDTDAEALVLICQVFIAFEVNDGAIVGGIPLRKSSDTHEGTHRYENDQFNARRHVFTKRRNGMSIKSKVKSIQNKPVYMQPRLPVPKKHVSHDAFVNTAHMIENLDKENALEHAKEIWGMRSYCAFHFGGVLTIIQNNKWYEVYGFSSFRDFVQHEFGISKSTAYDFILIYDKVIESGVSWDRIKHLGWTKIRLIGKCLSEENLEEWIDIAQSKNAIDLRDYVRTELLKEQSELVSNPPKLSTQVENDDNKPKLISKELAESVPIRVVYNLFPEQKSTVDAAIEHALQESETSHKNVALEYICMGYLNTFTVKN